jgi:CRISPR-associated endoribonuclease Cas6
MNLLSLVLTLRPVESVLNTQENPLPLWWGRAAHALLLDVVKGVDDILAEKLHSGDSGPRPFTASTLMGSSMSDGLDKDQTYLLRLTAIRHDIAAILIEATESGYLSPTKTIELDNIPFQIETIEPQPSIENRREALPSEQSSITNPESPWSALTSYQELSAPYLLGQVDASRLVTLSFTSPVVFKSGGIHIPVPMSDLVFGSLLDRWNAFAPIAFPPEVRRYAEECLAISRYRLSSRVVPVKGRGRRIGGVGKVTYITLNYDRYWMSVIHTLSAFALFSGVGTGTAMGLGQCRVIMPGE